MWEPLVVSVCSAVAPFICVCVCVTTHLCWFICGPRFWEEIRKTWKNRLGEDERYKYALVPLVLIVD